MPERQGFQSLRLDPQQVRHLQGVVEPILVDVDPLGGQDPGVPRVVVEDPACLRDDRRSEGR